jgi:ABC-2 type transport system ATP-binding protein
VIEIRGLTKRYGRTLAVDDLSFDVIPGRVTGFLGPNGAGKSTTMRAVVSLDAPDAGTVRVNGHRYTDARAPLREVGSLLEARSVHPGRSAFNHLLFLARSNGIPRRRVTEVLELVGLGDVAGNRAGQFSLGMGQRLGIAAALLGDPPTVILDEPANGLDPEGIIWTRNLLKSFAAQGRAVLVSSHLMAEMALTADHLVVIGRGRLIADTAAEKFVRAASGQQVLVRSTDQAGLRHALARAGAHILDAPGDVLVVQGMTARAIGEIAAGLRVVLHELTPQQASLEQAFMQHTAKTQGHGQHDRSGALR